MRIKYEKSCLTQDEISFTHANVVYLFIADELNTFTYNLSADFSLRDCSFESIKPTKNAYPSKY